MVSFSCENCGDVLTKKKLDNHRNSCRGARFTCLDCMQLFTGTEYRSHTSCISEAQKYQGKLYKPKPNINTKQHEQNQQQKQQQQQQDQITTTKLSQTNSDPITSTAMVRAVEQEETQTTTSNALAIVDAPPEAPSPPPMPVNVFDFLIKAGDDEWESDDDDDMQAEYISQPAILQSANKRVNKKAKNGNYNTPDARRSTHERTISQDSTGQKKSGKRKRGHPEDLDLTKVNGDIVMTDDTPTLHTGLTGAINKLMGHKLPPSPDDSPNSPIKRSRREGHEGKEKSRRKISDTSDKSDHKRTKHHNKEKDDGKTVSKHMVKYQTRRSILPGTPSHSTSLIKKPLKQIEYNVPEKESSKEEMQLVKLSHPPTTKPVASFLHCLGKGVETEEGVSVWRALKRWKRDAGGKENGEKELWKNIKIRSNDRGELIICV